MKIELKTFTDAPETLTQPSGPSKTKQSASASGPLASEAKPALCTTNDNAGMSTVDDSPSARVLRERQAAATNVAAGQTGADGTGQGDGPSGRPELTAEQAEERRVAAEGAAQGWLEAAGVVVGVFNPVAGAGIAAFGKLFGQETDKINLPSAQEGGGTAGASSTNPLDRAWSGD